MTAPPRPASPAFPLAEADLCVKCGLCLPHCPTYGANAHEGDSPRGRIALMQGLVQQTIPLSPKLEQHLDGCLGCRSCETVCPAKVPYGRLIDAGRRELARRQPARTRRLRLLGRLLTSPNGRRLVGSLLWLYQALGLQALLRRFRLLGHGRFARLESLLPPLPRLPFSAAPRAQGHAEVALFVGCVADLADRATLEATDGLLRRLGIEAQVPPGQTCCGAIYQHAGLETEARRCAAQNAEAFAAASSIVGSASGCTATLLDAPELLPGADGRAFRRKVRDVHTFLLERWRDDLELRPLAARVALHLPCTQRNVVGGEGAIAALLRKIPQLELVELRAGSGCCGAAGSYFLSQPDMADQLLEPKLDAVARLAPDYLVSSNIGCSLHLAAGLRRRGLRAPEVLHPVTLLARQLARG